MNLEFLAGHGPFRKLAQDELAIVSGYLETQEKAADEVLYRPGDVRDRLRIIESGRVEVVAAQAHAEEWSAVYGVGQLLNEGALLQEGTLHVSQARTLVPSRFILFRRERFVELAHAYPLIAGKIQMAIGSVMAARLQGVSPAELLRAGYLSGRTRGEKDLLGTREIPSEAYFGIQTLRALENFHITGVTLKAFPAFVHAFAQVKRAAAAANRECGLLEERIATAIGQACDEICAGHWLDQFVVDMIQGGAGTSTNMNLNEVIANRACEILGGKRGDYNKLVHPNNHVNLSQSTNDAYPTAVRVAALHSLPPLLEALRELCGHLGAKAREFDDVLKMGRTQLQDAVPMTLGQEFEAFRITLEEDISRLSEASRMFLEVNLGGTAIGTGLNAPATYAAAAVQELARLTGYPLVLSANLIEATPDTGAFVLFSGFLKRLAVKLSKVCNDLRLLSSGPRCGFGEISLPPMQPGSSIMPGKVNPVIPEVVNQVAFQVIGNDLTITMAAEAGQLQLNVMEPVIVFNLFQSVQMLTRAIRTLSRDCVSGIAANREVCRHYVENSIGVVTALNPVLGYDVSTRIAKEALETGKSVVQLVREQKLMDDGTLATLLSVENMLGRAKK